jgi:hypothetical protein
MNNPTLAGLRLAVLTCLVLACAGSVVAEWDDADRAVLKKLNNPVTITGEQQRLEDAIASITAQLLIKPKVNWTALEIVGIEKDTTVWLNLKDVAAEHALQIALAHASADAFDDDKAGYEVLKGELVISTYRDLRSNTTTENHDIRKYIAAARGQVSAQLMVERITELIYVTIGDPDEWLDEESTISENLGKLTIKTTAKNHEAIKALFDQIDNPVDNVKDIHVKEDRATAARLKKIVSYNNDKGSLSDVIDFIRQSAGLNIAVNWASLELVSIDQDSLVTISLTRVPASQLLRLVLDQVSADAFDDDKAGMTVKDGVVHIATRRQLKGHTETQVYKLRQWLGNKSTDQETIDEVVNAIHTRVGDPDEWLDEESYLTEFFGLLIVKTTPENHQALVELLDTLNP